MKTTFIDNKANSKGQQIYFNIYEEKDKYTEYPLVIHNCTILQNKVSSPSSLIFLEWRKEADLFFTKNRIKLDDNLIAFLFDYAGEDIHSGNLSCKANSLLPSHDLLCNKSSDLYQRVRYGFQNSDTPKDDIVFNDVDKCKTDNNRCQTVVSENTHEHVVIEASTFKEFKNEDNGGANYFVNCGVTLNNDKFIKCESTKAGGGAIFIMNDLDLVNHITLENIVIESCTAVFGGAAYIYASSPNNRVNLTSCSFKKCIAQKSASNAGDLFGGALYLTVNTTEYSSA